MNNMKHEQHKNAFMRFMEHTCKSIQNIDKSTKKLLRSMTDYVTDGELYDIKDYCIGQPCQFGDYKHDILYYGIIKDIDIDRSGKYFVVSFCDCYIEVSEDPECEDSFNYNCVFVDNNTTPVKVSPLWNRAVIQCEDDTEFNKEESMNFIISSEKFANIVENTVEYLQTNDEIIKDIYEETFQENFIDYNSGLLYKDVSSYKFKDDVLEYHKCGAEISINISNKEIEMLSEWYKNKVISFEDKHSIYFGTVKRISRCKHNVDVFKMHIDKLFVINKDCSDIYLEWYNCLTEISWSFNERIMKHELVADMEGYKKVMSVTLEFNKMKIDALSEILKKVSSKK